MSECVCVCVTLQTSQNAIQKNNDQNMKSTDGGPDPDLSANLIILIIKCTGQFN